MSEEPLANVFDYLDNREFLRATYAEGKRLKKLSYRAFSRRAGSGNSRGCSELSNDFREILHLTCIRLRQALVNCAQQLLTLPVLKPIITQDNDISLSGHQIHLCSVWQIRRFVEKEATVSYLRLN